MSLDSGQDVANAALDRADELTDGSSRFQSSLAALLSEVWREIYVEHPWLGLRAYPPQAFITQPASKSLLLTTTANSINAVLSAAPTGLGGALVSIVNWWIMVTGKTYYLRVAQHNAGSVNVILDTVAPETLAAVACTIAQLEYSLVVGTGVLADALWAEGNGFDGEFVPIRPEEELRREYPGIPQQSWPPTMAARIAPLVIRLSHWDITPHRIEVAYNKEVADPLPTDQTPLAIPSYLRPALVEGLLALLYEMKKDDRRPLADARYDRWISKAKSYESQLRTGQGDESNLRRGEPYGENAGRRSPYSDGV